jgi:hypothetical protein
MGSRRELIDQVLEIETADQRTQEEPKLVNVFGWSVSRIVHTRLVSHQTSAPMKR